MAYSIAQINAISTAVYDKTITQQVYDENPFLKKLRDNDKVVVAGGDDIRFPVRTEKLGTAENPDWDDQMNYLAVDTRTSAVLEWAKYRASTLLRWEEVAKAQEGKQRIVNIIKDKTDELVEEISYFIATDMFASTFTDTNKVVPIPTIIDAADSYGGIAVADAADWKASAEDTSSTKMTRALLYEDIENAKFGSHGPNFFLTTRALAGAYNALLGADERYQNTKEANAGFNGPTLYGYPVIGDPYVGSGDFYGIDLDAFEMFVMKDNDMKVSEWIDLSSQGHPDSMAKVVKCVFNIVCRRRRTNFKLTALTGI